MMKIYSYFVIATFLFAWMPPAEARMPLRPTELIENAGPYLHHSVEVEIVEPLYGPSTTEALAKTEYGQVEVLVRDTTNGGTLSLVPSAFKLNDPNRYRHKFPQVIKSPIVVRGELLKDDELSKTYRRPAYVLRVSSIEPIDLGPAKVIHSLSEIQSDPARWNRQFVVYEGVYENRFEVSALDKKIWLEAGPNTEVIGKPNVPLGTPLSNRVRVTGILFSKPGASYGHMGGYDYELFAHKIEYLGKP